MQDPVPSTATDCTQVVPELSSEKHRGTQSVPPGTEKDPDMRKQGRKTSSSANINLFREEELADDDVDISADTSLAFRNLLDQSSDRYRIEKMIAVGGFGQIFLAEDKILKRKAVIKSLKQEFLTDKSVVERFISEAKVTAQLKHPSIVPLYSLDTDSINGLHLAMQLIRGITLKTYLERTLDYLKEHRSSQRVYSKLLRERLELFVRICDALAYCHDRHILHNDLKPDNIMLARYGQVYVMDWGIASADGKRCEGNMPGTVCYMPPEKIASRVSTCKTDIFAMGMILNEVVTLRGPISGDSSAEVIEKICTGNFEPSTCVLPKYRISQTLRAVVEKARNPNPEKRYHTVNQLSDDIRHYLFYEEVKACPDSLFMKITRFLFHHKMATALSVLFLLIAFGCTAFFNYYRKNEAISRMNAAMLRNLNLQTETEKTAMEVGRRVILLQEQLRSLGSTVRSEAENPAPAADAAGKFYMNSDYAPRSPNRPHGLIYTAYYKYPVTLDYGTFYQFGKSTRSGLEKWVSCFRKIHSQMLSVMFMNANSGKTGIRNDRNKIFHLRESLIRRILFLINGGVVYSYPGMYDPVKSPEEFQVEYIRKEFRGGGKILWSPPYTDRSGYPAFSCWQTLYDFRGRLFGTVGFEISARELLKPVIETAEKEKSGDIYVIVGKEEQILYSSDRKIGTLPVGSSYTRKDQISGEIFYQFPHVLRKLRNADCPPNFPVEFSRRKFRIYWTKIPDVEWILLRHVPVR